MNLTADYIRSILDYDPDTGIFVWKARPRKHFRTVRGWKIAKTKCPVGSVAVTTFNNGYLSIGIDGKSHQGHRLAYLHYHGTLPDLLDHINGIPDDNRIRNLRPTTRQGNARNSYMHSHNASGFNGVSWDRFRGKWAARIKVSGKQLYLGRHDSLLDAVAARMRANRQYSFSARHGENRLY